MPVGGRGTGALRRRPRQRDRRPGSGHLLLARKADAAAAGRPRQLVTAVWRRPAVMQPVPPRIGFLQSVEAARTGPGKLATNAATGPPLVEAIWVGAETGAGGGRPHS